MVKIKLILQTYFKFVSEIFVMIFNTEIMAKSIFLKLFQ